MSCMQAVLESMEGPHADVISWSLNPGRRKDGVSVTCGRRTE
jgi:hypothetical protein